jgi:hypothetical protein
MLPFTIDLQRRSPGKGCAHWPAIARKIARYFPFAIGRSDGFNATPNRIALFSTLRGGRFICAAISSSDLADAASCIKRRSSAKRQRRFIVAAIYFDPFASA